MAETKHEKYNPTPHLLAFVDALGFRKTVEKGLADIDDYLAIAEDARKAWRSDASAMKITSIGDSTIFAVEAPGVDVELKEEKTKVLQPLDLPDFKERLADICAAVAMFQSALAEKCIWVRGAITYDRVDFLEHRIVGPAFHRAIFLEEHVAKFPRVIIDSRITASGRFQTAQNMVSRVNAMTSAQGRVHPVLYDFGAESKWSKLVPQMPGIPHDVPTFIDYARFEKSVRPNPAHFYTFFKIVTGLVANCLRQDVEHFSKHKFTADYLLAHALAHCGNSDMEALKPAVDVLRAV